MIYILFWAKKVVNKPRNQTVHDILKLNKHVTLSHYIDHIFIGLKSYQTICILRNQTKHH